LPHVFFFQAEDGIRDFHVTGVQTCALPIFYEIKPPKGSAALQEALDKTNYVGPAPVPFSDYVEGVVAQTIKKMVVTRRSIRKARSEERRVGKECRTRWARSDGRRRGGSRTR